MASTLWILESVDNKKFPYRLSIRQEENVLLSLRVQDRWPGQKGNIFCIREENGVWEVPIEEIERVPVISLKRFGKRLAIVLDRVKNKRCDFLFLKKKYKTRKGEYEQIFWRTEQALKERRPRVKLTTYRQGELTIVVDSNERYAWRFPKCNVKKARLPVGDYALMDDDGIAAVVERKTFDNLLLEFGKMAAFHQQLSELEAYRYRALVIEANYSDFLNSNRLKFYTPSFSAKAIAELFVLHPKLLIIFAGNRKLAAEWTSRFFSAIQAHEEDVPHPKVAEAITQYGTAHETRGGIYYEIKKKLMVDFPHEFTTSMVKEAFPDVPEATIKRVLRDIKKEGTVTSHGRGAKSCWKKTYH